MKIKRLSLIALALLAGATAFAEVPIKILQGNVSSSNKSTLDVVCQTTAGATATINGVEAKVYKTGAFGLPVRLENGSNKIEIAVTLNGETATKTLKVSYSGKSGSGSGSSTPKNKPAPKVTPETFYAYTTEGAYLAYGNGSDRLGASKMGYVDAGIPVKVIGKSGDMYKVQMSEHRTAFMDKDCLQTDQKAVPVLTNSESISIDNSGRTDDISVRLGAKTLYHSWIDLDPTILYVDLFGVMNNSNWITHGRSLEMVDYVECRQVESDVLRLVIRLKHRHPWGYSLKFEGNSLKIKVKHTPELSLSSMNIGLDAGHGGSALGAVSVTGANEKDINLSIVYKVKALLERKGARVTLTRTVDQAVSMAERRKIMLDANVDLLVSIHNNASGSVFKPMGTSLYYKYIQNRELADCVLGRILELDGVVNRGLIGNFNFALGTPIEYPTFLVEGLFVSSMPDEELLLDEDFQQKLAEKIVAGLQDYIFRVQKED